MSTLVHVERTYFSLNVSFEVYKLRKELNLKGSYKLDGGDNDLWSQIAELEKTPCHELQINGLDNVEGLEGVVHAKLSNNLNLSWLILVWDHDDGSLVEHVDTSVLERLVPPRSLQHLGLEGYRSIDFPRWILDIPFYVPRITTIFLLGLKQCSHLPPLGRLPNLRALTLKQMPNVKSVGREFYGDYGRCQKLIMIVLGSMDNMEEWWTTRSSSPEDGEFLIPNLHLLAAFDCPKLKFLPYPPRSVTWMVENSDHVLPEHGFGSLSSTTSPFYLNIEGASLSSEGWRRIQYLSSIEGLELRRLTGLETLPEAIRCFRSLRKLEIISCDDLETLPEWLGDFTSLREIRIQSCPKLSSLPESIQRLTELKKLRIIRCPALFEKCQGEDRHKIAHIAQVISE
jgi:aquaporin TIP